MEVKIHQLASGATVLVTSPGHGFKFSDDTVAEPQSKEVCDKLTLTRTLDEVTTIKGMAVNEVHMILSVEQMGLLDDLAMMADIVLVPFPVLAAIREQGVRGRWPNALAFNPTPETQRSVQNEKIVDINNWSY